MDNNNHFIGKDLGKIIQKLRKQNGLTQERLARLSGVSYTSLTKVENGAIKNPSFQMVVSLAKALEVSLDNFISDADA